MTHCARVVAVALALWSVPVAAQTLPAPFGPGPVGGAGASLDYAAAQSGSVSSQRLRAEVSGTVAVACGLPLPLCLALELAGAAEMDRLEGLGSDTRAGFGGMSVGAAWWPVRGDLSVGLVARAADLGRTDEAGGNLTAGLEARVGEPLTVAVRLEGLRRRARGGFPEAFGSRVEATVRVCRDACAEVGGGVTVVGTEALGRVQLGVAAAGDDSGVRMFLSRELAPAGAATIGVEWLW